MQKYIVTDSSGRTPEGHLLAPGKYVHSTRPSANEPMAGVVANASDTPALAVVETPLPAASAGRLFMLKTWSVAVDSDNPQAYTIVKETSLPPVQPEHKLAFILTVAREIYEETEFTRWVDGWLTGTDRSVDSARNTRRVLERERNSYTALHDIASMAAAAGSEHETMTRAKMLDCLVNVVRAAEAVAGGGSDEVEVNEMCVEALSKVRYFGGSLDLVRLAGNVVGDAATGK